MRTHFTTVVVLCALSCSFVAPVFADERPGAKRPNVIVFLTDDQGFGDLGANGNRAIRTPNLDRFAEQGVRMSRFYCSPVCAPTRASLLTGRYHYRTGVIHTSRGGAKMFGDEVTLAEYLAEAGYATGVFGKWHLGDNYPMRPQDQGFQETLVHKSGGIGQTPDRPNSYFDPKLWKNGEPYQAEGYCTDVFVNGAIEFIEKNRQRPFFAYVATNAPHTPLEVDSRYSLHYERKGLGTTTAKIYGMIENIDENFGRLLKKLDELGIRDNTLVWFLGDNGPQQERFNAGLLGRKGSVFEGGIRVPSMLQWPAGLEDARQVSSIAAHIDVLPTVLDAAGIKFQQKQIDYGKRKTKRGKREEREKREAKGEEPAKEKQPSEGEKPKNQLDKKPVDGRSLLPALRGEAGEGDRHLFFQCHRGLQPKLYQNAAVVTQRFKLVFYTLTFDQEQFTPPTVPHGVLYDVLADPRESHDIFQARPRITADLADRYRGWFEDVRRERDFAAGLIVVSKKVAGDIHLCRYQDATYAQAKSPNPPAGNPFDTPPQAPIGWRIQIVDGGKFRLTYRHDKIPDTAELVIAWNGKKARQPISPEKPFIDVELGKGEGLLRVRMVSPLVPTEVIKNNGTNGDVILKRL